MLLKTEAYILPKDLGAIPPPGAEPRWVLGQNPKKLENL